MQRLTGKRILVGITGSIAAYKAADIIRSFIKNQAEVRVVMTQAACEFVTPLTFQALSGNPVCCDLLDTDAEAAMGHIELAYWADVILIAPTSANFMAKLASGVTSDLLSAICLATKAPIFLAPAMNEKMWLNAATQHNQKVLLDRGVHFLGPIEGMQACKTVGAGHIIETNAIVDAIANSFEKQLLSGLTLLITAGPTRESIDPIRYISNHSSGKMGFALAEAASDYGANVVLIAGPVHLELPDSSKIRRIDVVSTQEMYEAVHEYVNGCDIFIGAAAVADYRPSKISSQKIKKHSMVNSEAINIPLVQTVDIIKSVAAKTENRPFVVGFSAETENLADNARQKLTQKNLDLVLANYVGNSQGFYRDDNQITVFGEGFECNFPKMSKRQLARFLLEVLAERYHQKKVNVQN